MTRPKSVGARLLRSPIIGIAAGCARGGSSHAAAPPSSVMNSRRLISNMRALARAVGRGAPPPHRFDEWLPRSQAGARSRIPQPQDKEIHETHLLDLRAPARRPVTRTSLSSPRRLRRSAPPPLKMSGASTPLVQGDAIVAARNRHRDSNDI